jgi:hypothetical protein
MPNINAVLDGLKLEAVDLAKDTFKDFTATAKRDVDDFLNESREQLERWTTLLVEKQLTKEEYEMLVRSLKTSAKMEGLLQKGVTKARTERFLRKLLVLVIDKAFTLLV